MDFNEEFSKIIFEISSSLGKTISNERYKIIDRGMPHKPEALEKNSMGIYTFLYEDKFLKIGKAGPNSNARFLSQHYSPNSSNSNLASSIISDPLMQKKGIDEDNVSKWIKGNCRRIDILFDSDLGILTLGLIEAALHYKYEPIYEGFSSQR